MEYSECCIKVEEGYIFLGTRDQFRDCFFDNANDQEIISWCIAENYSLNINGIQILE